MKLPCFKITRQKTKIKLITFCTPEALDAIIEYLETHPPQYLEAPLFRTKDEKPLTDTLLAKYFQYLNNKCGFGTLDNGQVKFRSHAVGRKYFATTIQNKVGLQQITIDFMSGRSIGKTSSAYFKADPETLKEQYMLCIEELSINDYKVETLQSDEKKELIALKEEMEVMKRAFETIKYIDKE